MGKIKNKECTYCEHEAKYRIEPHEGIMWLYLCELDKECFLEVSPEDRDKTFLL